jgi:hypothetical protein
MHKGLWIEAFIRELPGHSDRTSHTCCENLPVSDPALPSQ